SAGLRRPVEPAFSDAADAAGASAFEGAALRSAALPLVVAFGRTTFGPAAGSLLGDASAAASRAAASSAWARSGVSPPDGESGVAGVSGSPSERAGSGIGRPSVACRDLVLGGAYRVGW